MSEQNSLKSANIDPFLYSHQAYQSATTSQKVVSNGNLQRFAQKIFYLCSLESNGKISSEEAYQEIRQLWQGVKASKQDLFDLEDGN